MNEEERYDILKKEVDSIQIQLAQEHGPWYKKPSNLIALVAFLFSFGTTIVSYVSAYNQDVAANHREATALIQRISKLPIDAFELMEKYKGSGPGEQLSGMINQENILLATQAANLIQRYPNTFSSTEYFAVAVALATSNIVDKVPYLFEQAIKRSESSNDYNASARAYAALLYSKGDREKGKRFYEMALSVWDKFPEQNSYFVDSTDLVTLMYWSQAEYGAQNLVEARRHIAQAKKKLATLPPGPMTQSLANQIKYVNAFIEGAPAGRAPVGAPAPGRPLLRP